MYEGSDSSVHGGVIANVEARHCQGCFAGYPINGLYQTDNICANPICKSHEPPRGGKDYVNLWGGGDNYRDNVLAYDILVEDSQYVNPCDESEGRIKWEHRNGEIFVPVLNGGPGVTEM